MVELFAPPIHGAYTARQTRDAPPSHESAAPRALGDCSEIGTALPLELEFRPTCLLQYSTRQRRRVYWLNSFSIASFTSPLQEASAALHCSCSKPISINCLTDSSLPLGSPWLELGLGLELELGL